MATELYYLYEQLTKLPELPNSLQILYCYNNELQELPKLPNLLKELNCNNNLLQELPYINNKHTIEYKFSNNNIKYVNSKYLELNDDNKHLKYVLENIDLENNPFYKSSEYNEIMNS